MIGEGEVYYQGGLKKSHDVFEKLGIDPLDINGREGLALINGTSAMTAIGLVNVINAKKLLHRALVLSAFMNEISQVYDDHHAEILNKAKMTLCKR